MRCLRTVLLPIAVWSISATAGYAECMGFGPFSMERTDSGFVFDGTVLQIDGVIAQMQVHRVFKGRLPARIELYALQSIDDPVLEAGQRYVLAIERRARLRFQTAVPHRPFTEPEDDPTLVWGTLPCGGALRDALKRQGALDGFGRGWPPER